MSIAEPQNRSEFKEFILTKLGKPVLEINVADEQLDVVITEAFQYFNERNHFNGVERVYLTTQLNQEMRDNWRSYQVDNVAQTPGYQVCGEGQVVTLQLEDPGAGYPPSFRMYGVNTANEKEYPVGLGSDPDQIEIVQEPGGERIAVTTSTGGDGTGLKVFIDEPRTGKCGILSVSIYQAGFGYQVGDLVSIAGGSDPAVFRVMEVNHQNGNWNVAQIREQNNFITLPKDVVGVTKILRSSSGYGLGGGGIVPPGMIMPNLWGQINGNGCDNMGFGLSSYYIAMSFIALIEFLMLPPKMYNFNQRTHRLHIDGDLGDVGQILCLECMVKPNPDIFPDLWNDMWLKEFAYALTKAQWGRNLTKYNQVQLPGGIVINGERILNDAQNELQQIKDRFSMDWMDPPLDEVG